MVNHRYLGNSGLKVSELTYGNWPTHGPPAEHATTKQMAGPAHRAQTPGRAPADGHAHHTPAARPGRQGKRAEVKPWRFHLPTNSAGGGMVVIARHSSRRQQSDAERSLSSARTSRGTSHRTHHLTRPSALH